MRNVITILSLFILLIGALAQIDRNSPPSTNTAPAAAPSAQTPALSERTRKSDCRFNGHYPDKSCTPGDVFPDITKEEVCVSGYARRARYVTAARKNAVYRSYGIEDRRPGEYKVDHLIPLKIGGSNEMANLWPHPAEPRPGFHEKDIAETYLIDEVCAGRMPMAEAQRLIAHDWVAVFHQMPERYKKRAGGNLDDGR